MTEPKPELPLSAILQWLDEHAEEWVDIGNSDL